MGILHIPWYISMLTVGQVRYDITVQMFSPIFSKQGIFWSVPTLLSCLSYETFEKEATVHIHRQEAIVLLLPSLGVFNSKEYCALSPSEPVQ